MTIDLQQGDCLELMKAIPDESIDMIFCDPPYGSTDAVWDRRINIDAMWAEYKRIIKSHGVILIFGQLPFTVDVINANRRMFRYEWIWEKTMALGFLNSNKMPMRAHESILVFYKHLPTYNPQFTMDKPYKKTQSASRCELYDKMGGASVSDGRRYPRDVIKISNGNYQSKHSTQKPIELLEYMIKTYTNEGDVVLDNCMGGGATGIACVNLNRNFIGMELNEEFFNTAKTRIEEAQNGKSATG